MVPRQAGGTGGRRPLRGVTGPCRFRTLAPPGIPGVGGADDMTQADQRHPRSGPAAPSTDTTEVKLGKLTEVVGRGADGRGTWGVRAVAARPAQARAAGRGGGRGGRRGPQGPRWTGRACAAPPRTAATAPDAETGTAPAEPLPRTAGCSPTRRCAEARRFGGTKVGADVLRLARRGRPDRAAGGRGTAGSAPRSASPTSPPASADAASVGLTLAVVALVVLVVAYFAGGYVAGRLARFDGARNGFLSWVGRRGRDDRARRSSPRSWARSTTC